MSEQKDKILHIGEALSGGGAESVFRDSVLLLRSKENSYEHLVATSENLKFEITDINCHLKLYNTNNFKSIINQIYSSHNFKVLYKYLLESHPNIIHIHNYGNLSPSVLAAIYKYKKINTVKVIQTVHTFELLCSHNAGYDYKQERRCLDCSKKWFKFKIFSRGCSRAGIIHSWGKGITSLISDFYVKNNVIDLYITPSDFLKSCLETSKRFTNIKVIRNPLNKKFLLNPSLSITSDIFQFIYFGRFSKEKNIINILKAFNLIQKDLNVKLLLVGQGEELDMINSYIATHQLEDKVIIYDFLQPEDLKKILLTCNSSILSSKCFETASLVIAEAVLNNLIPITPNHGAMKEMVELIDFGVTFDADDYLNLKEKMVYVYNNYHFILNGLDEAKSNARMHLNQISYYNSLISIYEN